MVRTSRPARLDRPFLAALAVSMLLASACSEAAEQSEVADDEVAADQPAGTEAQPSTGFDAPLTVVVANSPGSLSTAGPQRVMAALIGEGPNAYLGGDDQPVRVRFAAVEGDADGEVVGEWLTTNASDLGLYVMAFTFTEAGPWEVVVSSGDAELGRTLIEVVDDSTVPAIGEPAPPSLTPTAASADEIAAVSTDPEPDPSFYRLSIAEAVGNGRPTVVAFATPAFCQTALCGPTIEFVKGAVAGRDGLDVVHVEPFDIAAATQGSLEPIPAMFDWGLVTEPWVFIIDAEGNVAASFEGIIGQAELERALDQL